MWDMFKVSNKDTRTTWLMSFFCLYSLFLTDVIHCSGVSIGKFDANQFSVYFIGVTLACYASLDKFITPEKNRARKKWALKKCFYFRVIPLIGFRRIWLKYGALIKINSKADNSTLIYRNSSKLILMRMPLDRYIW